MLILAGTFAVLAGCQHRKDMPVPAPQSAATARDTTGATGGEHHPVLETIFSRVTSERSFAERGCQHPRLLRF
jgi:hypothetical protein